MDQLQTWNNKQASAEQPTFYAGHASVAPVSPGAGADKSRAKKAGSPGGHKDKGAKKPNRNNDPYYAPNA